LLIGRFDNCTVIWRPVQIQYLQWLGVKGFILEDMKHKKLLIFIVILVLAAAIFGFVKARHASAPTGSSSDSSTTSTNNAAKTPQKTSFNKQQYSVTDPNSPWVVVNKKHPLNPKTYAPTDLTAVGGGQYMRAEAARALTRMVADAKVAGYVLTPASGYRSYDTQVSVYNNEVKAYGKAVADSESARPGYSEHQSGWAIDLSSGGCNISDCFGDTPGGKWATANAYKYGFLLRYPADKVDITGYRHETWHFRYIGTKLSTELHRRSVHTLEEFFGIAGGDYN
jgi:D-alanyl-D-alanine carboxypeptidase